jgi:hypothetical protein
MTLAHAVAKAPAIARDLRREATKYTRRRNMALLLEQARAVEIMADVCRLHLAPATASDIAEAMVDKFFPKPRQVKTGAEMLAAERLAGAR